jgi:hypothetical protein
VGWSGSRGNEPAGGSREEQAATGVGAVNVDTALASRGSGFADSLLRGRLRLRNLRCRCVLFRFGCGVHSFLPDRYAVVTSIDTVPESGAFVAALQVSPPAPAALVGIAQRDW